MKIQFAYLIAFLVCLIYSEGNAQQTQTYKRQGYTLTFVSQDPELDVKMKDRMVNAFFDVYPVLVKTFNPKAIKHVRFLVDTAYAGVAEASNGEVRYSSNWLRIHPEDIDVVTHEVMHLVQAYPGNSGPGWLTEGIADYVRYTFGVDTEGRKLFLPAFDSGQHYTNSYRITARFLVWLEKNVKLGVVKTLDKAMRTKTYSDQIWGQQTGKTLDQLWESYAQSPSIAQLQTSSFTFTNGVIADDKVYQVLEQQARTLVNDKKTVPLTDLTNQLTNTQCRVHTIAPYSTNQEETALYQSGKESVLIIGTLYKCSHCPNDHIRSASGFVIAEDGIGVTSYHIFRGQATNEQTDVALVAMDYAGNVYPITSVLAASKANDVAIFRLDTQGKKLKALPLGDPALAGEKVNIISHPHSLYYSFSQGLVSRTYWRDGGEKMSVTADFSQGSSGAAVLNSKGNVVGVVSATRSLYNQDQHVQMVVKEAIPVNAIRELLIK